MDSPFYCKNGKVAHSLEDLAAILKDMPMDEFSHHVTPFKNDFSNWMMHVLQDAELAGTVRKCNTKEEALAAIKEHMMRKDVSKRLEAYIGEKVGQGIVKEVDSAPVLAIEAQKQVREDLLEKKGEMKKGEMQKPPIEVGIHETKKTEVRLGEERLVRKDIYTYFTLKEFILGVLLGFVLGFVVSKLLFSLVLS